MGTACAGLFTFGIMTSFLGATLQEWSARLAFDLARGGALFSFLYFPQIPMVFLAGPLIDRFGKKPVLVTGFLFSAGALVGMAYAPSYAVLGGLLIVLGLGSSAAMAAANTLIPDLYPDNPSSALNLGGIFFGVGAIFFPWVVTLMTSRLGLAATLWMIALLVAAVSVVGLLQTFPPVRAVGGFDWNEAGRLTFNPAVILLAWILFFYSAIEISTAGWIRTYLESEFRSSAQSSSAILTSFWIALMLGRLAASQIVKRVRGPSLVLYAAFGAILGLVLMAIAPSVPIATAGILLCGLSFAPVFPTTAGTASTYFSRIFGTVFGILMAHALLSGAIVPRAVGYVAQRSSVRSGLWLLAGIAALLFLAQALFLRYEKRKLFSNAK
jgi:FHS family glucose/mannose:H+ symporter-like MFS transporter